MKIPCTMLVVSACIHTFAKIYHTMHPRVVVVLPVQVSSTALTSCSTSASTSRACVGGGGGGGGHTCGGTMH